GGQTWHATGTPGQSTTSVSAKGNRIAWFSGAIRLSQDSGASFSDLPAYTESFANVVVHGDMTFVKGAPLSSWFARSKTDTAWQAVGEGVSFGPESVWWECSGSDCTRHDGAQPTGKLSVPLSYRRLFPTSAGLFGAPDFLWDEACRKSIRPGLLRHESGAWVDAAVGLPGESTPTCSHSRRYDEVTTIADLDGTLVATSESMEWTARSDDGGKSWTKIRGERMLGAVHVQGRLIMLFPNGLFASHDDGSFETLPAVPGDGVATSLAQVGNTIVVSRQAAQGPSIWASRDAVTWSPVAGSESYGPVVGLSVSGDRVGIATTQAGALETSRACLELE
ncbi:MAG: hypothetical protein K0S65_5688, partial [Labilithrix sp.]|nr:hypothetical protein [Labilithrix sp.]